MILEALSSYYRRLIEENIKDVPTPGYSYEKISFVLVLSKEGELVDILDIRDTTGKKPRPTLLRVPQPPKRSVNIEPCLFWDNTAYVLGITGKPNNARTLSTHEAFKNHHIKLTGDTKDIGLEALIKFLEFWSPEKFVDNAMFSKDILDTNIVFKLDDDNHEFLHERPAAKLFLQNYLKIADDSQQTMCLVNGHYSVPARLHPSIKGVHGAQSSGASLVAFNLDASTSYGKKQGDNAPISGDVAFAYTAALNYLLRREESNRQRIQFGNTTVIFWAEAETAKKAHQAQSLFANLITPPSSDDIAETGKLRSILDWVASGRPTENLETSLDESTKIYVLGLSPNASRLSVRFWEQGSISDFAQRLAQHYQDISLVPTPWKTEPSVYKLVLQMAPIHQGSKPKLDDVKPFLAGELLRSILTGARYPQMLLGHLIMRMRADGQVTSLRVALIKAVLVRGHRTGIKFQQQEVIPVSLDINNTDPGYVLGRLFSTLENIQASALGDQINAPIGDRYLSAASSAPASIFPFLLRNAQHHLSKIRKDKVGLAKHLNTKLCEVTSKIDASFPRTMSMDSQGSFFIGYYHQTQDRYTRKKSLPEGEAK